MSDRTGDPDVLAAHALDAMDLAELESLDDELDHDRAGRPAAVDRLREAAALLALETPAAVPSSLRDRVIAGALERRASGVAAGDGAAMPRAETYRAAVAELPADQRRAIELAYFDGCTFREVAVRLGIPEGTAKSRLRLALARLANLLGPEMALT